MYPDIVVIGESLIDVVRRPEAETEFFPGGSPLNVAVGLGRLGRKPRLATWFGDDELGELIETHCEESHVSLTPGSDGASRTSTADATIDEHGHADYVFDIDWQMPPISDTNAVLIHTGSIGALVEPGASQVLELIESTTSFVTFDPNCRPTIMGDAAEVRTKVERYVAASDLVKVSDEDLAWLYPEAVTDREVMEQLERWLAMGPRAVVLTQGNKGAVGLTHLESVRVEADTSHGLTDTVGAGDSFMAGLINGILSWGPPFDEAFTNLDAMKEILAESALIAGVTVSRAGANPPWFSEIEDDLIACQEFSRRTRGR